MTPPVDEKVQQLIQTNSFVQLLAQLDSGRVVTDLAEKYPALVEKVKQVGKKGTLTLTLSIKPDGAGEVQTVEVDATVTAKNPEKKRKPTTFFVTDSHELSRVDPGQTEIEFPAGKPRGQAAAAK